MTSKTTLPLIACGMALAVLAGCASKPTLYYTLAAPVPASAAAAPRATGDGPLVIELAPLAVPERLARPQLVVRQPGNTQGPQVEVLEQHRWSASFENELRDALAGGVADRLGAVDVTRGARLSGTPVWRIAVQVRDFDAIEARSVDATLSWTVRRSDQERSLTCQWSASEPVGPGIDALALGAQRVTARAAEAIAGQLTLLQGNPGAGCRS